MTGRESGRRECEQITDPLRGFAYGFDHPGQTRLGNAAIECGSRDVWSGGNA